MTPLQDVFYFTGTCFFIVMTTTVLYGCVASEVRSVRSERLHRKQNAERDIKLKAMAAKEAEAYAKRKADQPGAGPIAGFTGNVMEDVGPGGMATSDPPSRWDK